MSTTVLEYRNLPVNYREAMRYACAGPNADIVLFRSCAEELGEVGAMVSYSTYPYAETDGILHLGFAECSSKDLQKTLTGCSGILVFACTIGARIDRLVTKYEKLQPSRALCFQGLGASLVETACDLFCADMKKIYRNTTPRFSPGYGDLPLELQKQIIPVLDCTRKIGITLGTNLLMTPTKSVTAIIGIRK